MFKLEQVIQFQEDEAMLLLTKRHPITLVPHLVLAALLIIIPFFFLFPLFKTGPVGVVVFIILVCAGIFVALRSLIMWDGTVLLVTDFRTLYSEQTGIFSRTVTEISAANIFDAKWEQNGIIQKMFDIGSIYIAASSNIDAKNIMHPLEAHRYVNETIHRATSQRNRPEPPEKKDDTMKRITKRLEDMSSDELQKVERELKTKDQDITIKRIFAPEEVNGKDSEGTSLKPLDEKT